MKARKLIILMAILVVTSIAAAQPPDTLWTRTFGGNGDESCHTVRQTQDEGFILVGWTSSFGSGGYDVWLLKTDAQGNLEWDSNYGGPNDDQGFGIQQTDDGGYILAGKTSSYGSGGEDVWLIRTDDSGDSLWSHTFGGVANDGAHDVQLTLDGGYLLAGYTFSSGAGDRDGWLIKTNSIGESLWTQTQGGTGADILWRASIGESGGIAVVGESNSFGPEGFNVWLGDTITFGGSQDDMGECIQHTLDGGLIIVGQTSSFSQGLSDVWLIKTNADGDTMWTRTYGDSDYNVGYYVQQTWDQGYIIAGFYSLFGPQGANGYVIRTDANGDTLWTSQYGGPYEDVLNCVQQTQNGEYILAGKKSVEVGNRDVWLILLESDTLAVATPTRLHEVPGFFALHAPFPNPFNASTMIRFQLPAPSDVRLEIFDLSGRCVGARHVEDPLAASPLLSQRLQPGIYNLPFDGSNLPSGIYLCRLSAGDFIATQKMILLK